MGAWIGAACGHATRAVTRHGRVAGLAAGVGLGVPTLAGADEVELPLHVLTLNTWGLPAPLAPDRAGRLRLAADWIADLDPDVVALQEVWRGAVPHLPRRMARSAHRGDDGLALGARRALEEVSSLRFTRARGFDALKQKGALRARVEGTALWVVSTHLQAGAGAHNARIRRHQVDELIAWLAPLAQPVILLGDLNLEAADATDLATAAHLAAEGFVDLPEQLGVLEGTYPSNGARYDRVLARGRGGWRVEAESAEVVSWDAPRFATPISDHLAVGVRLRLVAEDPGSRR